MKSVTIKADYIVKADLITMLKIMIEKINEGENVMLKIKSHYGGKLKAEFTDVPLPDLRQQISNPKNEAMKLQLKLNTTVSPQTKGQLHHCLTLSLEENNGKKEIVIENQEDDTKAPNSFYFLTNEEIDAIIDFLTISKVKIQRHKNISNENSNAAHKKK